jgi:hypothetical protein
MFNPPRRTLRTVAGGRGCGMIAVSVGGDETAVSGAVGGTNRTGGRPAGVCTAVGGGVGVSVGH